MKKVILYAVVAVMVLVVAAVTSCILFVEIVVKSGG